MNNEVRTGHLSHAPMTPRDWGYLAIFLVVAAAAGAWMGVELRKPFGIVWEGVLVHQESPIEIIELKNGQKLVRNKREGFEVQVPGEWKLVPPTANYNAFFAQPDFDSCKIEVYINPNTLNLSVDEWIGKGKTSEAFLTIRSDFREAVAISGLQGVKRTLDTEETGASIAIYVPHETKMYQFVAYPKNTNDSTCKSKFEQFLTTVRFR